MTLRERTARSRVISRPDAQCSTSTALTLTADKPEGKRVRQSQGFHYRRGAVDAAGEITSVSDFATQLSAGGLNVGDPPVWYRGVSHEDHALVPSVFRPPREGKNETLMIKRFMLDAHSMLTEVPGSDWDWLFLAQHHDVPTRLLDWTESPLHGLYFASEPVAKDPNDVESAGGLWVLNPTGLNAHALNDDRAEMPMFGVDEVLEQYSPLKAVGTAVHLKPAAALARRTFLRISTQWGTFSIHTNGNALEEEVFDKPVVKKFRIPADAKQTIRDELQAFGIEERTVYPDLHRLGRSIKVRF